MRSEKKKSSEKVGTLTIAAAIHRSGRVFFYPDMVVQYIKSLNTDCDDCLATD